RKFPLSAADRILHDPCARSAGAHTHAEAGQLVVEEDFVAHALRQREGSNGGRSQLHCVPLGRSWVGAGCRLLLPRASTYCVRARFTRGLAYWCRLVQPPAATVPQWAFASAFVLPGVETIGGNEAAASAHGVAERRPVVHRFPARIDEQGE